MYSISTCEYVSVQFSADTQAAVGKEAGSDHEEQEGDGDSGYGCSQPSESEFSDNYAVFRSKDDSIKNSRPPLISLSEKLEGKLHVHVLSF